MNPGRLSAPRSRSFAGHGSGWRALGALALFVLLAGCYLPQEFEADLTLDGEGRYAYRYRGDVVALTLLGKIGRGEVAPDEIPQQADIYARDLRRDSGFKEVTHVARGRYRTLYEREGDILDDKTFTFIRPNSRFLALKRREDGMVELYGDRPNPRYVSELMARGFDVVGQLRVWTDADVVSHNAKEVREGGPRRLYLWDIRSMTDPLPSLILKPG